MMAPSKNLRNHFRPSGDRIPTRAPKSIPLGYPQMKASGKTISRAPLRIAWAVRSKAFIVLRSRSKGTEPACTTATRNRSMLIALGSAYGRPDIILVPEHPLDIEHLVERVKHLYDLQKNVVIVCGEGIVDEQGRELGAETKTTDPAGNIALSGAAEALRHKMMSMIGDRYFQLYRRGNSREAIFTRKVGHTQRGGRPIY